MNPRIANQANYGGEIDSSQPNLENEQACHLPDLLILTWWRGRRIRAGGLLLGWVLYHYWTAPEMNSRIWEPPRNAERAFQEQVVHVQLFLPAQFNRHKHYCFGATKSSPALTFDLDGEPMILGCPASPILRLWQPNYFSCILIYCCRVFSSFHFILLNSENFHKENPRERESNHGSSRTWKMT